VNRANAQGVSVELNALVDASRPPVDSDRVAEIRAALQDGSYPVLPVKIADAMIAARLALGLGE
jgi:negative regulator of flagellin synthesis FlgM